MNEHKEGNETELIYYEAFNNEEDARMRERRLKMYGSAWQGLRKRISFFDK